MTTRRTWTGVPVDYDTALEWAAIAHTAGAFQVLHISLAGGGEAEVRARMPGFTENISTALCVLSRHVTTLAEAMRFIRGRLYEWMMEPPPWLDAEWRPSFKAFLTPAIDKLTEMLAREDD